MKTSLFIIGFSIAGLAGPAFANDPVPEKDETAEKTEKAEPLKRTEFIRQQNTLFSKADKNFDGRVTTDEIMLLRHETNRPKYVAAFKALDTNNNGFVSYEEVEARHEELTEQQISRVLSNKENLLRRYDQDGNGTITAKELDAHFERQTQDKRDQTAKNAAKDLKLKDTDDSGSVSLTEYIDSKASNAVRFARGPQPTAEQIFTRDPNGDKIITRLENNDFITRAFAALDKNKDDKLSAAEQSNRAFGRAGAISTQTIYMRDRARQK